MLHSRGGKQVAALYQPCSCLSANVQIACFIVKGTSQQYWVKIFLNWSLLLHAFIILAGIAQQRPSISNIGIGSVSSGGQAGFTYQAFA